MRCKTCKARVRFVDEMWDHVEETNCAAVVVDWPPAGSVEEEDEAA